MPTSIIYNGSVTFYGKWSLVVLAKNAVFQERVRIAGSLASDGPIAGVAGTSVAAIDGNAWQAFMEWSSDGGATWHPSRIHRLPGVTPTAGLIVTLNADDNTPALGDGDFNDLIVQLTYLNRQVNPLGPSLPPYSFTLPPGAFRPRPPGGVHGGDRGCECTCTCRPAKRKPKPACRCRH
jgi:hypothetical protein